MNKRILLLVVVVLIIVLILIWPKKSFMEASLLDIHDSIQFFDNKNNTYSSREKERDEQLMAYKYIDENDTVLELGCRYGTVSCLVARKCKKLVAVDPDKEAIEACKKNMQNHGVEFECLYGIVSKDPQSINKPNGDEGWGYFTTTDSNSDIPHYLISDLEEKFSIEFNTLIADCEGCLEKVFKENDMSKIKKIMYETDRKDLCDYEYISKYLEENGFTKQDVVLRGDVDNMCWLKL